MDWKNIVKADSKLDEESLENLRQRRENYDSDESSDKRERAREVLEANKMADDLITSLERNLELLKNMRENDDSPHSEASKRLLEFLNGKKSGIEFDRHRREWYGYSPSYG
jgi:molecular chaperone DnaK (HSP70)|tara:strand:+ start:109 stop:441 length:333 start_codon:yes stop_codon:yes gene_type:complete